MNKQENNRIQKWIESMKEEFKTAKNAQEFYKEDIELENYFLGKQDAYRDAIYAFKMFLNGWKKCEEMIPTHQEIMNNSMK